MAQLGMYFRIWIYLCVLIQSVYPLVNMELQVLQFDNPLGTSYTRDNVNSGRKCCDAGGSDCRSSSDQCDVYFIFCFGRYDLNHPGCQGTSIDMQQDVTHDVLKLTTTESKKLYRSFNVTNWNDTGLIVQALDVDMVPTDSMGDPHVFPDLIDSFKKSLDFFPASNYWDAEKHVISMAKHTSLDIQLRAWCAPGWYGQSCDQNDCTIDNVHECTGSGRQLNKECTDPDILVLNFNSPINALGSSVLLQENITTFLASDVCPPSTSNINVTVKELREKSDGSTDAVFIGFCDTAPISNLKIKETVYVMNVVKTRLTPVTDIFGIAVTSPVIKTEQGDNPVNIIILVRIVNYINLGSRGCSRGNSSDVCNPKFTVSFPRTSSLVTETLVNSGNLTDCNGIFIDVHSQDDQQTKKSTILFQLKSPRNISTETINVKVKDLKNISMVVDHSFLLAHLRPGAVFYDAQPYRFPTSVVDNTSLTVEVMAWCANCYTGNSCQTYLGSSCNGSVTVIPPSCQNSTDCMNRGTCIGGTCHCKKGWIGPKCNVDIDECAVGVCTHAHSCTNTGGGYSCTCAAGFTGNNCDVDIDECSLLPCDHGLVCVNTFGSYVCLGVCTNQDVGPSCTGAVDFCVEQPCRNGSTCVGGDLNFTCICSPGWQGSLCKTNVNECENTTICQNGGTCKDTTGSFQCLCPETYTGTYCEDDVDECLTGICLNNATCTNIWGGSFCNCSSGFTGDTCSRDIDECLHNPCVHSAYNCTNLFGGYSCGVCYDGWEGKNCDIDQDECLVSSLCANNGICINTPGSFRCNCTEQWTGHHCHQDVDECADTYACNYHGQCNNINGSFQCFCYTGWDGVTCDNDIDECLNSPCQNGGVCNNTDGNYTCDCTKVWKGPTCNIHVDECDLFSPCKNGGSCSNTDTHYLCSCPSSWMGENCTDDVDECLSDTICLNEGTCINTEGSYHCGCPPQWNGTICDQDVDECLQKPCKNNAACNNSPGNYSCDCTSAWTGENCTNNVNECLVYDGICNHGECSDTDGGFVCACVQGYQSDDCSADVNECENPVCQNGGTCENIAGSYICHCPREWTGKNCTVDYNECNDSPCLYAGTCLNTNGNFTCKCAPGRTGQTCEQDVDECANGICANGASCSNTIGSFVCTCAAGYEGKDCSLNINECLKVNCTNGGRCQDLNPNFKCLCLTGYEGRYCEIDTKATSPPMNVDVFSLQFTNPVLKQQIPSIKDGIISILKLLDCHDSNYIHVSLVHNSVAKPNIVEFYAQCDGHHLTNDEVNKDIRTLSNTKLEEYFPNMQLANFQPETKKKEQSWIASNTAIVGGAAGGFVVLLVVITAIVCIKRKRSSDNAESPYTTMGMEIIEDMDGKETITIRNPVYESMYKPESVS